MSGEVVPVLWLCGPPGVGKTAVGWEIYSRLARAGIASGYVDIDQLGMCYPEAASDPGQHRLKARNLAAVVAGYEAAGARCVVVSGIVDAAAGVHVDELPEAAVMVCRLRVGHDELIRRLMGRRGQVEQVREVLREADDLDAGAVADVCVDTGGLSVADVARRVRERTGGWPVLTGVSRSPAAAAPAACPADGAGGPILWLCGATGVGKSTVGFTVYQNALRAGLSAAYVDVEQIGFCDPVGTGLAGHRLRARNLAAIWQSFRAAGARGLVVVGPIEDAAAVGVYADALPAATITLCRLHAGRDRLQERIMQRRQGGSWAQPGDPLKGRPVEYLRRIVDEAVAEAEALDDAGIGLRVDTDKRTVEEAAEVIVVRSGWPRRVD